MADPYQNGNLGDTNVIELIGKIMVVAIAILFFVVVFVFCLHLYAKWFWYLRREPTAAAADFSAAHHEVTIVSVTPGLDPIVLKTLPILTFDPTVSGPLECAVCLCEISKDEKARLLPKCNHGFHLDCIDMWFQSHSTCPLCRNPVDSGDEFLSESPVAEYPGFPTNVLFWGDESQVSTFGPCLDDHNQGSVVISEPSSSGSRADGALAIDVPEEEEPKSPMPARLRSLKRILSSNNRRVNPCSPRYSDMEQGVKTRAQIQREEEEARMANINWSGLGDALRMADNSTGANSSGILVTPNANLSAPIPQLFNTPINPQNVGGENQQTMMAKDKGAMEGEEGSLVANHSSPMLAYDPNDPMHPLHPQYVGFRSSGYPVFGQSGQSGALPLRTLSAPPPNSVVDPSLGSIQPSVPIITSQIPVVSTMKVAFEGPQIVNASGAPISGQNYIILTPDGRQIMVLNC